MGKNTAWLRTQQGRLAGAGVIEDDYSEESGGKQLKTTAGKIGKVRFVTDNVDPETLNGEVIIVQKGKKKDGN